MAGCVQTWGHVKTGKIAEPNGISYRQEYDIWVQVQMQYNIYYICNYIYITHTAMIMEIVRFCTPFSVRQVEQKGGQKSVNIWGGSSR